MIETIKLKFGPKGKTEQFSFEPNSVTVFVGPNNSGKSLVLREIEAHCQDGSKGHQILESISLKNIEEDVFNKEIESMHQSDYKAESYSPGHVKFGRFNSTKGFQTIIQHPGTLYEWSKQTQNNNLFFNQYLKLFVSRFGGKERFDLIKAKSNSDLKILPKNAITYLFQSDEKRKEVRDLVFEAFNKYFVVDPTDMKQLQIRLSDQPPPSSEVERSWTKAAVDFYSAAKPITELSDGVQAFTGLVMSVIAGEEKVLLIDEPEAFLHPSLATLLGKKLSTLMSSREGNLIVSTHSPFFVMGCLQAGKKLNLVRLTYDASNNPTARLLGSEKVTELFKNPMLRSTGVIQALFHSAVIVVEGDTDRAFYNEINERLLSQQLPEGIANTLFLNAQNKQTVPTILKPLREMGIPAVGIVDFDFIKEGGGEFTKVLVSVGMPTTLHDSMQTMRSKLKTIMDSTDKEMRKGKSVLSGENLDVAEKFLANLAEYGLFAVPNGELESWLKNLGATGEKSTWLNQVFTKMGSDPSDSAYVKPDSSDVWAFMRSIHQWVSNPNRKGMML